MKRVTMTTIAAFVFSGLALSAQAGKGQEKVTICHVTGSGSHTITVANPAVVNAHLKHGDSIGECPTSPIAVAGAILPLDFRICDQSGAASNGAALEINAVGRIAVSATDCVAAY